LRNVAKLGPLDPETDPAPEAELEIEDMIATAAKPKRRRADGEEVEWLPAQESVMIAGTN
jgi:hypothetical protein